MRAESCGLGACLYPLLETLGWQGDRGVLAEYLAGDREACSLADFRNTMAALGYGSAAAYARPADADEKSLPCLFLDEEGGAFCLLRRGEGDCFVYDGVKRRYESIPLQKQKGTLVTFAPIGDDSAMSSRPDWLWNIASRFKAHFGASLGLSLVLGSLSLLYPILIATIYSQMSIKDNEGSVLTLGLGVAIFILADSGFRYLRSVILGYVSLRSGKIIGDEIFRRLMSFQASFTESASTEAQVRRVRDLRNVSDFVAGSALSAILDLPFVFIMILWLVSVGKALALVPTLGLLAFLLVSAVAFPAMKRAQAKAAAIRSARMDVASAIVDGVEDIAAGGMAATWQEKFRKASMESASASYSEALSSAGISAISGFFVSVGGLSTLVIGVSLVLAGSLPSSALVAAMMLVWRVLGIARSTFVVLNQIDSVGGSLRQLSRFMALSQETRPTAFTIAVRPPEGSLEFRDLSFRYGPEGYPALYAVSFSAAAGRVTSLSGHQGAGKTTALKLALGLYRPQSGRILIGPFNIQQSEPAQLRRAIAYVPEEPALLRGSLRDFIRGSSGAENRRIEVEAEALGLIEALGRDDRDLDAIVGEDEILGRDTIRLALICRALVKRSPVTLLDEQRFVRGDLYEDRLAESLARRAAAGSVVLVVSPGPRLERIVDRRAVLDAGRLVSLTEGR